MKYNKSATGIHITKTEYRLSGIGQFSTEIVFQTAFTTDLNQIETHFHIVKSLSQHVNLKDLSQFSYFIHFNVFSRRIQKQPTCA